MKFISLRTIAPKAKGWLFTALLGMSLFFTTCEDPFEALVFAKAFTGTWERQSLNEVNIKFRIEGIGSQGVASGQDVSFGIVWDTENVAPGIENNRATISGPPQDQEYNLALPNLSLVETYYYRAFIKIDERINYGDVLSFNLSDDDIVLDLVEGIVDNNEIELTGLLRFTEGPISDHGFVFSKTATFPGLADTNQVLSLGPVQTVGLFSRTLEELDFHTDYYVWTYIQINNEILTSDPQRYEVKGGWRKYAIIDNQELYGLIGGSFGAQALIGMGCNFACDPLGAASKTSFWTFDPNRDLGLDSLPRSFPEPTPNGRTGAVFFELDGLFYYGLGQIAGEFQTDFWALDPNSFSWTRLDSFPGTPRINAVGIGYDNKAIVGTGTDDFGEYLDDFWAFDPIQNKWGPMPTADLPLIRSREEINTPFDRGRTRASIFQLNESLYAGFGDTGRDLIDLWKLNINNTDSVFWELEGVYDIPETKKGIMTIPIGNSVYMGLARDNSSQNWFKWTPALSGGSSTLEAAKSFPEEIICPNTIIGDVDCSILPQTAFEINGNGYIVGRNEDFNSTDIWEFVPEK